MGLAERGVRMKRLVVVVLDVLAMLSVGAAWLFVPPGATAADRAAGPFEGAFEGVVLADRGSKAPVELDLTQQGTRVTGSLSLDEGLQIDGGFCGVFDLPAFDVDIEGRTAYGDPNRIVSSPSFDAGGFELTIDFRGELSADGETITATAKIDLPWFCGRDPRIDGELQRDRPVIYAPWQR
jgi:hypothetical protein